MWTLRGWSSFQAAWLLALTGGFAFWARPGEIESGIAAAVLLVGGLWALDRWVRNAYLGMTFVLAMTVAGLWVLSTYFYGGCLDWCRPWLGLFGLPTLAALAWSSAVGLVTRRTWAWTALAISPIPLFFLSAMTLPSTGLLATADSSTIFLGVTVTAMAVVWTAVGITARECLSWRRPARDRTGTS